MNVYPRFVHPPSASMRLSITVFPDELLMQIFLKIPDYDTALALTTSCQVFRRLAHPASSSGKRIWRSLRERAGWPDPCVIGISDSDFLRAHHGRRCNFCGCISRAHNVYWEFHSQRFCEKCLRERTVRSYELSNLLPLPDWILRTLVPGVEVVTPRGSYRMYLHDAICRMEIPARSEYTVLRKHLDVLACFREEYDKVVRRNEEDIRREQLRTSKSHEVCVNLDEFVNRSFPKSLHVRLRKTRAFKCALRKTIPSNHDAELSLVRNIRKELFVA